MRLLLNILIDTNLRVSALVPDLAHYIVAAIDLPGHGRCKKGNSVYFDSYEDLLNDLTIFIQIQKSQWPTIPHFILGTGFGGLVVVKFISESPRYTPKESPLINFQ